MIVRYGAFASIGTFLAGNGLLEKGEAVVVRTPRGREWGEVLAPPEPLEPGDEPDGEVLRRASRADSARRAAQWDGDIPADYAFFSGEVARRRLPLRPVAVERVLGGERVVFYVEPRGGRIEEIPWEGLVEALQARYDGRVEIREVGEQVRPLTVGCGDGGGCGKEGCSSRSAAAEVAEPAEARRGGPRRLPMASRSGAPIEPGRVR